MRKAKLRDTGQWLDVMYSGDYTWVPLFQAEGAEQMYSLLMCCPWCSRLAPLPYMVTVFMKSPLTLKEKITCGYCATSFTVEDGVAKEVC
jgi:hypothetical protein